ncbi:MAG: methylthioribulose 1-phosphate dehydratase [Candidatus Melainabacteria bacterium]|nr:methylthioribulose 1-phosphate dehydratase [Candidatus Melainabacteria bacterium]
MLDFKQTDTNLHKGKADIVALSHLFYAKNWSLATSSNYSMVLSKDPLKLLITASGKDKQFLCENDFVTVDANGDLIDAQNSAHKQSAETLLHTAIAARPGVGAVLHTHSVASTVLSNKYCSKGHLEIQGFEMIKAISLDNMKVSHETCIKLPIFANSQDMVALSRLVDQNYDSLPKGFLIAGHGLYAWGKDLSEAKRHIEGYEFLFEVLLKSGF